MKLEQKIINYAKAQAPHEMCGFVVFKGGKRLFIACKNIAADPVNCFEISSDDWLNAQSYDGVIAIVHSHTTDVRVLSTLDRKMQTQSGLDWWLVCGDEIKQFRNVPHLLGREFEHGVSDCYTLLRDAYMLSGVDLPDFNREEDWWINGQDLYIDNTEKHGFERVDNPQIGDVILMQVVSPVANHAAIYLGDNLILHQLNNRLSKRDLYDGYWVRHTHSIWRFKAWQKLDFTGIFNDLALSLN